MCPILAAIQHEGVPGLCIIQLRSPYVVAFEHVLQIRVFWAPICTRLRLIALNMHSVVHEQAAHRVY